MPTRISERAFSRCVGTHDTDGRLQEMFLMEMLYHYDTLTAKIIIIIFSDSGLTKLSIKKLVKYWVYTFPERALLHNESITPENPICPMSAVRTLRTCVRLPLECVRFWF